MPAPYGVREVAAIQAMHRGDASETQQRHAIRYIVEVLCGTYDLPFRPESARDSDFASGKMFVGQQLVKLTKINLEQLKKLEKTL